MPQSDLPLDELRRVRPGHRAPVDLDRFWATTLAETRTHDLAATFAPVDNGLAVISTLDVTFAGFGGSPVRAWLHLPAERPGPLPAVVEYVGYGGGRGLAARAGPVGGGRLRALRHGHARPGLDLGGRRHPGSRRRRRPVPSRAS